MNVRRLLSSATAVAAAAALLVGIDARAAVAPRPLYATVGPLVAGTSSYVDGTFVWTDDAYDDRGADTNLLAGGDTAYPSTMTPNNVADLVQLQLSLPQPGRLGPPRHRPDHHRHHDDHPTRLTLARAGRQPVVFELQPGRNRRTIG
jgi:hypothetical protein